MVALCCEEGMTEMYAINVCAERDDYSNNSAQMELAEENHPRSLP